MRSRPPHLRPPPHQGGYQHVFSSESAGRYPDAYGVRTLRAIRFLVNMVAALQAGTAPRNMSESRRRAELLSNTFKTFERNIREQLGRTMAKGGSIRQATHRLTRESMAAWLCTRNTTIVRYGCPRARAGHTLVGATRNRPLTIANSGFRRRGIHGFGDNQGSSRCEGLRHASAMAVLC